MKTQITFVSTGAVLVVTAVLYGLFYPRMDWPPGQHRADEALKLIAKDGNAGDLFGESVAMNAGTILIGAPLNNAAEGNRGAAYLYQYNRERAHKLVKLRAEEGAMTVEFGSSVALSGTTALIGTPGDRNSGSSSGFACVYQIDGYGSWKRVATLRPSEVAADERFGTAVAADNDIALIGARGKQGPGAAYVFQKDTVDNWREVAKLTADVGTSRDYFGCSVAVEGNRVAIGAQLDNNAADGAGAAYLFQKDERGQWSKVQKFTAHDAAVNGHFGQSIAMCGATVVVGAPGQGAVYLFEDDGTGNWRQVAKLTSGAAKGTFYFGNAVAISGTTVAVGSPAENNGAGAIYLFQEHGSGSWRQFAKLTHPPSKSDTATTACFGASLALSGTTLLAGARHHDGQAPKSGAAFLYRIDKIQ